MAEIFISHATKKAHRDDDQSRKKARKIRDRAFGELQASGHEPRLDQRSLQPGDDWSARLSRWLGTCRGALVIVDERGLESKWLLKESTILSWRCSQDPSFRLITVLVGGVSHSQLCDAGLDWLVKYQTIDATVSIKKVVALTVEAFAGFDAGPDRGPLATWIADVAARLAEGSGSLEEAAICVGIEANELDEYADPEITLAHGLLHAKPDAARRALEALWLGGLRGDGFRELVRLLRPLCVDPLAGAMLHCLLEDQPRHATINVCDADVGRLYLSRARHRKHLPNHTLEIDGIAGEGGEIEIKDELRKKLLNGVAQNEHMPNRFARLDADEQAASIARFFNKPEKHFLLLGQCARHDTILGHLRSGMPAATYLLLPGVAKPDKCAKLHSAPIVEPRLMPDTYVQLIDELTEFDNLEWIA